MLDGLVQGGASGYALGLVSVLLWSAVWLRAAALRRPIGPDLAARAQALSPERRAGLVRRIEVELEAYRAPIRALVAAAPLLGLLGTVSGMVELFDALHTSAVVRQGSIAGGISTALVTTQLGLMIGVPGLVAARLLERRQIRMQAELRHFTDPSGVQS
jgi:hypothetical protein